MQIRLVGTLAIGLSAVTMAACGSSSTASTSSPAPAASPAASAASGASPIDKAVAYEGTYNGTWNNTTFGSTGPAKIAVKVDKTDKKVELTMTLGGSIFGGTAPGPQLMDFDPTSDGGLEFNGKIDAFGQTKITIDASGAITWTSADVPSSRVKGFTGRGTISTTSLDMTSDVTFRDGSATAHDTIKLTK